MRRSAVEGGMVGQYFFSVSERYLGLYSLNILNKERCEKRSGKVKHKPDTEKKCWSGR